MRRTVFAALTLLVAGLCGGTGTAVAAFNVTGHWVGSAHPTTGGVVTLTADFTQEQDASTFTGTVVGSTHSGGTTTLVVNGVLGPETKVRIKVHMTLTPTDPVGRVVSMKGTLNSRTKTIRGTFVTHDEKMHHGSFKLVEA